MLGLRLYMAQRLSAMVMGPLVLGHLAVMVYGDDFARYVAAHHAPRGPSAADDSTRVRGRVHAVVMLHVAHYSLLLFWIGRTFVQATL